MKICQQCKKENNDDSRFCIYCGASIQESDKRHKTLLSTILGWVFGIILMLTSIGGFATFQIVPGICMLLAGLILLPPVNRKTTIFIKEKYNFNFNIAYKIITVVILFIIFGVTSKTVPTETSKPIPTETNNSNVASNKTVNISKPKAAPAPEDPFKKSLMKKGLPEAKASSLTSVSSLCKIIKISKLSKTDNWALGERYLISTNKGDFTAYFSGDSVDSIRDGNIGDFLYNDGAFQSDYISWNDIDKAQLQVYTEDTIKNLLISPSTAKFPWADWNYSKDKDLISISSYVDSQNGFGAMIRSDFLVKIKYDVKSKNGTIKYLELGGKVLINEK
jgi:hypothetical protein